LAAQPAEDRERVRRRDLLRHLAARLDLYGRVGRRLRAQPLGERARVVLVLGADEEVVPALDDAQARVLELLSELARRVVGWEPEPDRPQGATDPLRLGFLGRLETFVLRAALLFGLRQRNALVLPALPDLVPAVNRDLRLGAALLEQRANHAFCRVD